MTCSVTDIRAKMIAETTFASALAYNWSATNTALDNLNRNLRRKGEGEVMGEDASWYYEFCVWIGGHDIPEGRSDMSGSIVASHANSTGYSLLNEMMTTFPLNNIPDEIMQKRYPPPRTVENTEHICVMPFREHNGDIKQILVVSGFSHRGGNIVLGHINGEFPTPVPMMYDVTGDVLSHKRWPQKTLRNRLEAAEPGEEFSYCKVVMTKLSDDEILRLSAPLDELGY